MAKKSKLSTENPAAGKQCGAHAFKTEELAEIRSELLDWYDENKRDLPWRNISAKNLNDKAYAVWVSEIMCQQTQVATVIAYYNKWMKKWPTVQKLASASLDSVIEAWTGLGYYSRGRRLLEGAQKVVNDLNGIVPTTSSRLLKDLPGVGRYTASAIASISFGEAVGVVDGNVIRVMSRLRCIGADTTQQSTMDVMWSLANALVDHDRPGDFNQSMMELGATVCTPRTPSCSSCPVRDHCMAWKKTEDHKQRSIEVLQGSQRSKEDENANIADIEDACSLCLPSKDAWDPLHGVLNYPRKAKKKPLRDQVNAVCLIQKLTKDSTIEYLMIQRPPTGLLANMWEFPSVEIEIDSSSTAAKDMMNAYLKDTLQVEIIKCNRKKVGEVVHMFSHIRQTYRVEVQVVAEDDVKQQPIEQSRRWVTEREIEEMAVSTAMKKVLAALYKEEKPKKRKADSIRGQSKLDSFFKPKKPSTEKL